MKIENDLYIVAKKENDKTVYLTTDDTFTEDIREAAKAANKVEETAWKVSDKLTQEFDL